MKIGLLLVNRASISGYFNVSCRIHRTIPSSFLALFTEASSKDFGGLSLP